MDKIRNILKEIKKKQNKDSKKLMIKCKSNRIKYKIWVV
jgi:hypothetical protein